MSAIDNAFIRAYTLDTAAALAPAQSDYDDGQRTLGSEGRTAAESQRVVANVSTSAIKSPRRAVESPVPTAVAHSAIQRPAKAVAPPRRTPVVAAAITPTTLAINAPSRSAVPAPHIRLTSFIHATTTLDPSPLTQSSAILEPQQPDPMATSAAADAGPLLPEEPANKLDLADAPGLSPGKAADAFSNGMDSSRPSLGFGSLGFASLADPPTELSTTLPSTLPFSAAVAAKAELEPDAPRAAFEVDHFSWPDVCDALLEQRTGDFDQLVGQLVTESALGRKVVAITGSRRGEGRTTLALLLARRLAATAVKVVLVDADFEVPQLAARLGMTLQSGWENVLTDGLPVWDGLVESLNDRLTLLPLAPRSATNAGQSTASEFVAQHASTIRQHLDTLRKYFDVVLVDAGAVKAARPDAKPRGPMALAGSLDAAIMVSDARSTAPGRIADLQRRLLEARIIPLGIAENFCPLKPD